jgi:hypothetical protein
MKRFLLPLAVAIAACGGSVTQQPDAAPPLDDAAVDAAVDAPTDATPDAAAAPSQTELTGGGRLTGGTLVVDVQIGGPIARTPASGGAVVIQPSTPIKP